MASATEKYSELLCDFLSLTVTTMSLFTKIPQIYKIYSIGSSRGINLKSVLLEEIGYASLLAYNIAKAYPLESYFEYLLLNIEDIILIIFVLHSRRILTFNIIYYGVFSVMIFLGVVTQKLPDRVLTALISVNLPISVASKLLQIHSLYMACDRGQVSLSTWLIALYTSAGRLVTTVLMTGDVLLLIQYGQASFFSCIIIVLLIFYCRSHSKFNLLP